MNPSAEQLAAVYDFQGVMEVALKSLFTAREVKAFTSQFIVSTGNDAEDEALIEQGYEILDFQRDRPRVEITFTPGAGQDQFAAKIIAGVEMPVETSWSGQFKVDVITAPDIRVHKAFVIAVRFLLHTQLQSINGSEYLPLHRIQPFAMDAGTSPQMKTDQGDFQTTLLFDIQFSIQDDAWDLLAAGDAPPPPVPAGNAIEDTGGNPFEDTGGNQILGI
jgi:hypothetical protein